MMFEVLTPELEKDGYKPNKKEWYGFKKITNDGESRIMFGTNSYGEQQYCHFTQALKINSVEKIFKEVNAKFNIDHAYNYSDRITFWGYDYLMAPEELYQQPYAAKVTAMKEMSDFLERYKIFLLSNSMIEFEGFLSDLRKFDSIINGEGFWEEDVHKGYAFGRGLSFSFRRTSIGYLCENKRINDITKFHIESSEKSIVEYPEYKDNIINGLNAYHYLIKYLEEARPLY